MIFCCSKYLLNIFPKTTYLHKYIHRIYKMDKAYLRHLDGMEKFEITFHLKVPEYKVNREFNFCRNSTEAISSFLSRVATNVEKVVKKKNKNAEDNLVKASVLANNLEVDSDKLCKDVFTFGNPITLRILNQEYDVIIDSPWINVLTLPNEIMAGFLIYPNKFEAIFTNNNLSSFVWYKSRDKKEWIVVGESFFYKPSNSDIDFYLKLSCVPKNERLEGPIVEVETLSKIKAGPGECPFELRHKFTTDRCLDTTFRVVTYNILAELYTDMDYTREVLHPYCPPYALSMDYRKQLIIKELLGYNSDILCLQEVDRKIYNHDLTKVLHTFGYESDYCSKGGEVAEGSACFYNSKRFKKLYSERFVLSEHIKDDDYFKDVWIKIEANKELAERVLNKATALQVNVLELLNSNEIIVVANVHLYFHPDSDHIRLLQAGISIRHLERLVKDFKAKFADKRLSMIFCGDFNSVPECGVYQLFTTGFVPANHIDYDSKPEESINVELRQSFPLKSACGTPQYTNFTAGFAACLDYIFYQADNIEVVQVVPLPCVEELTFQTALPSIVFPSDHVALVADLKLL